MRNRIMLGVWRYMFSVPPSMLDGRRAKNKDKMTANLAFMTPEHRRVHHEAVLQLPCQGRPLEPAFLAKSLDMETGRVVELLNDLEEHKTFLFRNRQGEVVWAYPVTVEKTPHHVTFSTGEEIYAA